MIREFYNVISISIDQRKAICRMSVFITEEKCKLVLDFNDGYSVEAPTYSLALEELLKLQPKDTIISIEHTIFVNFKTVKEPIKLNETVKLEDTPFSQDKVIKFEILFEDDKSVYAYEDFGIAFKKLSAALQGRIETCAFCSNGDFKSDGGEDLRHGWYCFREVDDVDMRKAWYERLEYFQQAIPGMSAFYWCPKYSYADKIF